MAGDRGHHGGFRHGESWALTPVSDGKLVRSWSTAHEPEYLPGSQRATLFLKREAKYTSTDQPEEVARERMSRALSGKSYPKEPETQACTLGRSVVCLHDMES